MRIEDVELVRDVVLSHAGVVIDPAKTYLIESRLAPMARREGFASDTDLIQAVRARRYDRLMWALTEAMISSETCFFRDRAPFDQFAGEILPELAARRGARPIRVWSAACATGQEPYSLAMAVDADRSLWPAARLELLASDLSERCLEKAQSGLYTQFEVQRGLPIRLLVRYFEPTDDLWAISPRLRQTVRWRRVNLLADLAQLGQFDVIFCRNVISALDPIARRRVLEQLARALPPDGRLVLGVDETVSGVTDALQPAAGCRGVFAPSPGFRRAA
jgi:chemotaxis protein methyltransferase CheR